VIAVIVVLTKLIGDKFEENAKKILGAFNAFVGIALENAKIYKQSIKFTGKVESFIGITLRWNEETEVMPLFVSVLQSARKIEKMHRLSLYVVNNVDVRRVLNVGATDNSTPLCKRVLIGSWSL
jgi:hypothetical protein